MARLCDHLWGEVLWCSAVGLGLASLIKHLCKSKVNNLKIAVHVDQNVLELEIPMHNSLLMEIAESECNLCCVKLNFILSKSPLCFEEPIELSSSDEGHHKEEPEVRHEQVLHAHQELVLALEHDVFLKLCVLYLVVLNQNVFSDHLDRVKLLVLLELREEDLAEGSLSQHDDHFEIS